MSFTVCSMSVAGTRSLSHQNRTKAAIAVWTWETVSSTSFFPLDISDPGEEQIAYRSKDEMAFEPGIAPAFVMVHPQFALLILKAPLDWPAGKAHQEQGPDRRLPRCVAHEVLHLFRVQHVARDQQMPRLRVTRASGPNSVAGWLP
jgi:hypothetical protein